MSEQFFTKINGISVLDETAHTEIETLENSLGDLAYADTVKAKYTPTGTVSAPTFVGSSVAVTVTGTPTGTVAISPTTDTVTGINGVGTLPTCTYNSETKTLTFNPGTLPTAASAQTFMTGATAAFTGSSLSSTGTVIATGTVSQPTFTGVQTQIESAVTAPEPAANVATVGTLNDEVISGTLDNDEEEEDGDINGIVEP